MPLAVSSREDLATYFGTNIGLFASIHSADPGTTGANEITTGSPATVRKALTWTPGSVDGANSAAPVTFDVPANVAVTHVSLWTALTGGTWKGSVAISYTTQTVQGQLIVTPTFTN